jgi:hypothetical protein
MAAVDTPYEDRLRWNEQGATAIHGTYRVIKTGPNTSDVFYRSNTTQETEKLVAGISDWYHFCVDHNKMTLRITGAGSSTRPAVGRNEKTCEVCGSIHAGEC